MRILISVFVNVCLSVCAASIEEEVIVDEERPRVVMVGTAVCLTLERHLKENLNKYYKIKCILCLLIHSVIFSV